MTGPRPGLPAVLLPPALGSSYSEDVKKLLKGVIVGVEVTPRYLGTPIELFCFLCPGPWLLSPATSSYPSKARFPCSHPEPGQAGPQPGCSSVSLPVTVNFVRAGNVFLRPVGRHRFPLKESHDQIQEQMALAFLEGRERCLGLFSIRCRPTAPSASTCPKGLRTDFS